MRARRRLMTPALAVVVLAAGFGACGASVSPGEASDAGPGDGGPLDTGLPGDALPDTVDPVTPIDASRPSEIVKLDLLLVIDNSISMADKQAELSRRVPELIAGGTTASPHRSATVRARLR